VPVQVIELTPERAFREKQKPEFRSQNIEIGIVCVDIMDLPASDA